MTNELIVIDESYLPAQPSHMDTLVRETMEMFFNAEIDNPNTRRAYYRGAGDFFHHIVWKLSVPSLDAITPLHVRSWLDDMTARGLAVPTTKLRLAGLRMLFNALVRAQILRISPVAVVKGTRYSVDKGKTPVLSPDEMAHLLNSIKTTSLAGLRDRAIIATMAYTFARVGAVTTLLCRNVFHQQQRLWLRLSEKGGKCLDVPCHPELQKILTAWIEAAGHGANPDAPLFQSFEWEAKTKKISRDQQGADTNCVEHNKKRMRILSGRQLAPTMAWEMLQRRAKKAGIATHVTNHSFRATGITAYLRNGGTLERAARIAGHQSTRTTQLYDRRSDDVAIEEIERIQFI